MKNCFIYLSLLVSFFSLPLWILGENTTKLKKLFNWTANWSGELNTPDTQSTLIILLSANAVMQEILWTEEFFEFNQLQTQNAYTWASNYFLIKCTLVIWQIRAYKTFSAYFHCYVFPLHLICSKNIEFLLTKTQQDLKTSS